MGSSVDRVLRARIKKRVAGSAISLFIACAPWTLEWLIDLWSYTLILPGIIASVLFLVGLYSAWTDIKTLDEITQPINVMGEWEITIEEWRAVNGLEHRRLKKVRWIMFIVAAALFTGIAAASLFSSRRQDTWVGLSTSAVLTALAWFMLMRKRTPRLREPRVVLSKNGVALNGLPYSWKDKNTTFDTLSMNYDTTPHLEIEYGNRESNESLCIPVPPGRQEEAVRICNRWVKAAEESGALGENDPAGDD